MAFAITGSKYSSTTISSVGTTLVNTAAAVFVSTDFTVTRLLGLWDSAGTTFKGMAWARRVVTTSQAELQTPFFDPATGVTATQVVGDIVLVSKNFAESVVAGLAVSGKTVTVTDEMTFGSAASNSVCFYDEGKEITQTSPTKVLGGLTVWGKLDSYTDRSTSSACDYYSTNSTTGSFVTTGANSNFMMYGGVLDGTVSPQYFGGFTGTAGRTMIFWNVQSPFDFISPGVGGTWGSNASRMQLINCYTLTTGGNAIMRRWGDGVNSGGSFKFPNNTSAPISIFGSDFAGSITVAAPAGTRAIVRDMGNGPALTRTNSSPTALAMTFVNLITTDRRNCAGVSGSLIANTTGTSTFSFSDSYTNLSTGSVGVVLNSASAVADSILSSAATWSPTLLHKSSTGFTVTTNSTSWTFGFKKYGFGVESGSIAATTYDLGPAGTPDNVVFGGPIFQGADAGVTLSNAAANALASIVHYSDLYDASINWGTLSVTNAQYPSLSAYPIVANGTLLDLGAKSLTLDNAAGTAFAINTGTNVITAKATALATTAKFIAVKSTATITAAFTVGGAYTYVNGTLTGTTGAPTFTAGTANILAAGTYSFSTAGTVVSMTPVAISTYIFTGVHTGTLSLKNTSAFAITVQVPLGTTTTTAANTGGVITVVNPAITLQILRPNIINASNWVIRNVTTATELASGTTSAGTGINVTFTKATHYSAADVLEIRIGYCVAVDAKLPITELITAPALDSVNNAPTAQAAYEVYNSMGINGSAMTQFAADYTGFDVNVLLGTDFLGQNFMAWWVYNESTLAGLRQFLGLYTLIDAANIRNNTGTAIVQFDNNTATHIKQIDNVRIFRSDAGYPVKIPSTGGGAIDINWRNPVLITGVLDPLAVAVPGAYAVGTAGYILGTDVPAIKTLAGLIPAAL